MNVLLDSCALLALGGQAGRMSARAMKTLGDAPVAYCPITTFWEIAIKVASGKIRLSLSPELWIREVMARYNLVELPLVLKVACTAAALPFIHRDPFDRILVALALTHSLPILTSDRTIPKYPGIKTYW